MICLTAGIINQMGFNKCCQRSVYTNTRRRNTVITFRCWKFLNILWRVFIFSSFLEHVISKTLSEHYYSGNNDKCILDVQVMSIVLVADRDR